MGSTGIIATILIGIFAGWIAEKIMRGNHGLLMNLVVGVAGAFIGSFLLGLVGLAPSGGSLLYTIGAAVLGAVILLAVLRAVRR